MSITADFEPTDQDLERFFDKVILPTAELYESACWIWNGAHHSKNRGYGKFRLAGKVMNAHKAIYIMAHGPVPTGLVVAHQCNNSCCVNPNHLKAETQAQNMTYCVQSGRHSSQRK